MKPSGHSETLLGMTRSKAKMFEYSVPDEHQIEMPRDPARLFPISLGLLGDLAAQINSVESDPEQIASLKDHLSFSAHFFDAYRQAKVDQTLDPYLLLLGSASYYLCDLPGSAAVLAARLPADLPDLDCLGLEHLLAWMLIGDFSEQLRVTEGFYAQHVDEIGSWLVNYFNSGEREDHLLSVVAGLRRSAYDCGSSRQLLFADMIGALARTRRDNSACYNLPRYSEQTFASWLPTLQKKSFVRELWPAQRRLGEGGILNGRSGVVQMPTSAGKTRATELIIRSSFLGSRTNLAVIVAPFRALCHEIRDNLATSFRGEGVNVDELSDVFQTDFDIESLISGRQILVVTPEKLVYVLRHNAELAPKIGLLIYDEGHQFDSGTRGVTYELLVTSLKALAPQDAQTVLISAVISNADAINGWLNGEDSVVIRGTVLGPTYRSVAFASWLDKLGRLEFVSESDPEKKEFFVPRVLEEFPLQKLKGERTLRKFPRRDDGSSIALYLGLKLISNGSVAIFCGTKSAAASLCETAVDIFVRQVPLQQPVAHSNQEEVQRLCFLHECNLGGDSTATQCARLAMFAHHGNTPHGIRLAVEFAMKEGSIKFVICTSTLAQGVNLPIRYLIVNNTRQGAESIKVRDFHNLIGRAGRAGMHTEGSILFANPAIYDHRATRKERWRWSEVKDLLEPGNSEPCISTLLEVFRPFVSDDGRRMIKMEPLDFVRACIDNPSKLEAHAKELAKQFSAAGFSEQGLAAQTAYKRNIVSAIESYLMAYGNSSQDGNRKENIANLARGTLAYYLAHDDEPTRLQLIELFTLLANNIDQKVPEESRRGAFGKTLYGLWESMFIEQWVTDNASQILASDSQESLLLIIWPMLSQNVRNSLFKRCNPAAVLQDVAIQWIKGTPYLELFVILTNPNTRFGKGKNARYPTIEHIVDICENAFGYDGMLAVGAVAEIFEQLYPDEVQSAENLRLLQKRLKYGLPSSLEIFICELGFSDRVVSMDLAKFISGASSRSDACQEIRQNIASIRSSLDKYPSYFTKVLDSL